jgi:hypothetical protein
VVGRWSGQSGSEQFLPRQGEVARPKGVTEGAVNDVFCGVSSPSVMPSACHLPLAGEELGWMSMPLGLLLFQEHWRGFVVVLTRSRSARPQGNGSNRAFLLAAGWTPERVRGDGVGLGGGGADKTAWL